MNPARVGVWACQEHVPQAGSYLTRNLMLLFTGPAAVLEERPSLKKVAATVLSPPSARPMAFLFQMVL